MAAGEWKPAGDHDVWMRALTDRKYIYETKENGCTKLSLHNRALKGKAVNPPLEARPWSLEVSGKLLSLVADVIREGEAFIEKIKVNKPDAAFHGYAYAAVSKIRETREDFPHSPVDVVATPYVDDPTHSDTVMSLDGEVTDEELDEAKSILRDWLQEVLVAVRPGQAHETLESIRITSGS